MTEFEVVIRVPSWKAGQRLGWSILRTTTTSHADIEVREVGQTCPFCNGKIWCEKCDPFGNRTHGSNPFPLEPAKEHDPTVNFILAFGAKMEARYQDNVAEKGSSWVGVKKGFLYDKLDEEYCEVFQTDDGDPDALMYELVDLGVVAAMCHARELYTKQGRGK
jgi:hypothetical protein